MNMKNFLLSTSALATAVVIGTAAQAGSVGSKDAMSVSLGGEFRFYAGMADQDVSAGRGRGYSLNVDETEVFVEASNTADNGILYGVKFELNAGAADGTAADEAYAFIDSEVWGRLELGDNDDATDRMYVESDDALVGRLGPDGDASDYFNFGGAIAATGNSVTGDATKATYLTPRFGGFQLGASLTPDSGVNSGTGGLLNADNNGDFENVYAIGANWEGSFDQFGIVLSATGEFGDAETATGADTLGEVETYSVGGKIDFAGFALGAGYVDFAEQGLTAAQTNAGADAGSYWTVGGSYTTGPWGVSVAWFDSSRSNAGAISDTEVNMLSFDAAYDVAPGWQLAAALHLIEADNINATAVPVNNEGTVFLISNQFNF